MTLSTFLSALWALVSVAAIGMVILYAATFYAIDKSRERVECYKRTQGTDLCAPPDWIERAVRRIAA